jgi:hypothetical protein
VSLRSWNAKKITDNLLVFLVEKKIVRVIHNRIQYIPSVTSVDPDQSVHLCSLIRIYIVCFEVHYAISDKEANSVDPDQTA